MHQGIDLEQYNRGAHIAYAITQGSEDPEVHLIHEFATLYQMFEKVSQTLTKLEELCDTCPKPGSVKSQLDALRAHSEMLYSHETDEFKKEYLRGCLDTLSHLENCFKGRVKE